MDRQFQWMAFSKPSGIMQYMEISGKSCPFAKLAQTGGKFQIHKSSNG
jgi:hypothetical protein